MWPRVVETMLGVWLAMSPFIFRHPAQAHALWASDWICSLLIVHLALFSYWRPAGFAHLLLIPVGLWLVGFGYVNAGGDAAAGYQSSILTGLTLLMFAIIPNRAANPPEAWVWFLSHHTDEDEAAATRDRPAQA